MLRTEEPGRQVIDTAFGQMDESCKLAGRYEVFDVSKT